MTTEEIQELMNLQKQVVKVVIEDDEMRELNAKNSKLSYDAFVAEGFTESQAIALVAASIKATN